MLARSLIVLLVVLNLGVALWWLVRDPAPAAPAPEPLPAGAARLQLASETAAKAKPAPVAANKPELVAAADPAAATASEPAVQPNDASQGAVPAVDALQCYALGPFAGQAAVDAARRRLQPRLARLHVREVPSTARRDWRVWLPPQADRAAAQALVDRITAAGFSDYFIVASGDEANAIALGRYGSEASARRRQTALQAAGFADVRADPLGEAPPSATWLDVAASTALTATDAGAVGADSLEPIDCEAVPATPSTAAR